MLSFYPARIRVFQSLTYGPVADILPNYTAGQPIQAYPAYPVSLASTHNVLVSLTLYLRKAGIG